MDTVDSLPVAVIGAGPVGLAAAAHLAERHQPFVVVEAGDEPAATVRQWAHVRVFSPWRYNVDTAARRLLTAAGWVEPDPDVLPTGAQLVRDYLRPLADLPAVKPHLRYRARVTAVTRLGLDRVRSGGRASAPFLLRLADGRDVLARAVVDASGTWYTPNPLGGSGIPAHGEADAAAFIEPAMPDVLGSARGRFAGRTTLVVGSGYSAVTTLLDLADLAAMHPGTEVLWAIRAASAERSYGGGSADALPARGAIGSRLRDHVRAGTITLYTGFSSGTVTPTGDGRVTVSDGTGTGITADRVVRATGFRPDYGFLGELRLDLDPVLDATRALAPLIDPNEHSCGTVPPHGVDELAHPEPGFYAIGAKSYGRAPTFLLATGYEQARSVAAALAGDWAAAREVHLELPETGVCSSTVTVDADGRPTADSDGGCCGPTQRGLATGLAGGLLPAALQLLPVGAPPVPAAGGCCG
jgi:hypothetical protein